MQHSNKFQVFTAGILFAACLLVLPLALMPLPASSSAISTGTISDTDVPVEVDSSPNIITQGMYDALDGLGGYTTAVEARINRGLSSTSKFVGKTSAKSGKLVMRGFVAGAGGAGRAVGVMGGVPLLVAHTSEEALNSLISAPVVSALTRPADNTPIPVIQPNAPILSSINAETSPVQPSVSENTSASWPIHGVITTEFGVPHWPFQPTHTGIDISDGKTLGTTPIHPFEPGIVVDVVHSGVGFGNHVVVDHGNGLVSLYGHMYKTAVTAGQKVDSSTVLGYEGSTGASTGSHVHFEIHVNSVPVNPHKYVEGSP